MLKITSVIMIYKKWFALLGKASNTHHSSQIPLSSIRNNAIDQRRYSNEPLQHNLNVKCHAHQIQ
jgi:hypothetical protein